MGELRSGHPLLGRADAGELILLISPAYERMQPMAAQAGIKAISARKVRDVQTLKAGLLLGGRSMALMASAPEVEGRLGCAAFGGLLTDLAFEAARVVYFGARGTVLVHPVHPGTQMAIYNGHLQSDRRLDEVDFDGSAVGVAVNWND